MIKSLLTLAILIASLHSYAQDILTTKSGEDIRGKVIEVNATIVRYKKFDAADGTVYEIPKSDLVMIRYENGSKDIFTTTSDAGPTDAEYYSRGQRDASLFYNGYKGAGTVTLVTGLLSPLGGLVPAIICSSVKPKTDNLDYPDASLMKNSEYSRGYMQTAKKIKRRKVWKNYWISFGINLVALLALDASH